MLIPFLYILVLILDSDAVHVIAMLRFASVSDGTYCWLDVDYFKLPKLVFLCIFGTRIFGHLGEGDPGV